MRITTNQNGYCLVKCGNDIIEAEFTDSDFAKNYRAAIVYLQQKGHYIDTDESVWLYSFDNEIEPVYYNIDGQRITETERLYIENTGGHVWTFFD